MKFHLTGKELTINVAESFVHHIGSNKMTIVYRSGLAYGSHLYEFVETHKFQV